MPSKVSGKLFISKIWRSFIHSGKTGNENGTRNTQNTLSIYHRFCA